MVSIIITPRERYAFTRESVSSILADLGKGIEVVFVAGKAPKETLSFLEKLAKTRPRFTLIQVDRYLRSNEARNIGLKKTNSRNDVLFIENDVVPRKGWLAAILRCARETKADIVAPLIFEGDPEKTNLPIHIAGADFKEVKSKNGGTELTMDHFLNHEQSDWRKLRRRTVDTVEFHCMFVRRKLLDQVGLDNRFDSLGAHVDLCFEARKYGAKTVVEPRAHVVFLNPDLMPIRDRSDFEFFVAKWSERACRELVENSSRKWGMDPRGNFLWMYRYWCFWNKWNIFSSFNVLTRFELFFWRAIRVRMCPEWVRESLENYLVARIRAGFSWS
jgi:GT2 family glycosyltransferase